MPEQDQKAAAEADLAEAEERLQAAREAATKAGVEIIGEQGFRDREHLAATLPDTQLPPLPSRDEFIQEFLNAPISHVQNEVRRSKRRNRTVWFARRDNYRSAVSVGADIADEQQFARHIIEVDSAEYMRMSADTMTYVMVDPDTGQPLSKLEPVYIPIFEHFDDRDLETVCARWNINASGMDRAQRIMALRKEAVESFPALQDAMQGSPVKT